MDTYQKILTCAAELFAEKGFEAVSMRDIASQAGMRAPSLYNHFRDKQSLYQATLHEVFSQHNTALIGVLTSTDDPHGKLQQVVHISLLKMAEEPNFRLLLQRELLQNERDRLQFLAEEVMADTCHQLQAILQLINPQADHHFVITSLMGHLLFHVQIAQMRDFLPGVEDKHADLAYLSQQIYDSLLKSLK